MSIYDERPWLGLYAADRPREIEPEHPSALAMFRATSAAHGDRTAIHYFDASLSFGEVDALTDALAAGLQAEGLGHGDRIGLYLQNVPQFVLTMLAAWKAGAIPVSINPMLKGRELETLLTDSGAIALVTLESLWDGVARDTVPRTDVRIVVTTSELDALGDDVPPLLSGSERRRDDATLDLLELAGAHRGQRPDAPEAGLDDVAFLTYTSGTTGPPKGAMNTHRNVVFNSQAYRDWVGLSGEDVVLGVAPLFHITGLIGHVGVSMLCGAPLVLSFRFDPAVTLELIERHRVTFVVGAIPVYIALMNAPDVGGRDVSSLRATLSGGAPVARPTVDAFRERFGTYIVNIYGLTETTSPSHCVPIGVEAPTDPDSGALSSASRSSTRSSA